MHLLLSVITFSWANEQACVAFIADNIQHWKKQHYRMAKTIHLRSSKSTSHLGSNSATSGAVNSEHILMSSCHGLIIILPIWELCTWHKTFMASHWLSRLKTSPLLLLKQETVGDRFKDNSKWCASLSTTKKRHPLMSPSQGLILCYHTWDCVPGIFYCKSVAFSACRLPSSLLRRNWNSITV